MKNNNTAALIGRLRALSQNLWWSWNPRAQAIFEELSPLLWESSNHNPVAVLAQFSEMELVAHLGDPDFLSRLLPVLDTLGYRSQSETLSKPHDGGYDLSALAFCRH